MRFWVLVGVLLAFATAISCNTPKMTEEEKARAKELGSEVKTLEQQFADIITKIDAGGLSVSTLLGLKSEAKEIAKRIQTVAGELNALIDSVKARAPDTWGQIGGALMGILYGLVGYGVGRPARKIAGKYILNGPSDEEKIAASVEAALAKALGAAGVQPGPGAPTPG